MSLLLVETKCGDFHGFLDKTADDVHCCRSTRLSLQSCKQFSDAAPRQSRASELRVDMQTKATIARDVQRRRTLPC